MIDRVLKQVVCPTSESAREGRAYYIKAIRMRPCRRAGASFCRETPQKGHKVTDVRQDCLKTERSFRPQRTENGISDVIFEKDLMRFGNLIESALNAEFACESAKTDQRRGVARE
jgi:hypothetical protein